MMCIRISKVSAVIGLVLLGLSGLLYIALVVTSNWEQARSPEERNLGVAVLFMIFGIPMLCCAATGVFSFLISVSAYGYHRLFRPTTGGQTAKLD
jgi:hypothetical protein